MKYRFYRLKSTNDFIRRMVQITFNRVFLFLLVFGYAPYEVFGTLWGFAAIFFLYFGLFHVIPFFFQPFVVEIEDSTITFIYWFKKKYVFDANEISTLIIPARSKANGANKVINFTATSGKRIHIPDYWVDFESLKAHLFETGLVDIENQNAFEIRYKTGMKFAIKAFVIFGVLAVIYIIISLIYHPFENPAMGALIIAQIPVILLLYKAYKMRKKDPTESKANNERTRT